MQVLACILQPPADRFKADFWDHDTPHDTHTHHLQHPRLLRDTAMMAPVIIMGAIMMFVFWDTSEHR
jgi:hypothetical protein